MLQLISHLGVVFGCLILTWLAPITYVSCGCLTSWYYARCGCACKRSQVYPLRLANHRDTRRTTSGFIANQWAAGKLDFQLQAIVTVLYMNAVKTLGVFLLHMKSCGFWQLGQDIGLKPESDRCPHGQQLSQADRYWPCSSLELKAHWYQLSLDLRHDCPALSRFARMISVQIFWWRLWKATLLGVMCLALMVVSGLFMFFRFNFDMYD